MMDLKEIIKWFIPCFHILLDQKLTKKWILVCLLLFFNLAASSEIRSVVNSDNLVSELDNNTKKVELSPVENEAVKVSNQSEVSEQETEVVPKSLDVSVGRTFGRTFGRPFKKMMAGLLPVIFQLGAASTWAVVAAVVGFKTLLVTLVILKILLLAGAAKVGALFASKSVRGAHAHWEPPHAQKEIHLHIHNNPHDHDEHVHEHLPVSSWSREGYPEKPVYVVDPYNAGPQTISTPYGNYIKIDSKPGAAVITT